MAPKARKPEVSAEDLAKNLPVTVTGIRPGEFIEGFTNNALGGVAIISPESDGYPPSRNFLQMIWDDVTVKPQFFNNLRRRIPYFESMTDTQIEKYLKDEADRKTQYNIPFDDDEFQLVDLPPKLKEMSIEARDSLLGRNVTGQQLRALINEEFGTSILTFMNKWWRVLPKPTPVKADTLKGGWILNLTEMAGDGSKIPYGDDSLITVIDGIGYVKAGQQMSKVGFYLGSDASVKYSDVLDGLVTATPERDVVTRLLKRLPPSALKSLLQKIIRFRPKQIEVTRELTLPAEQVLVCVAVVLAQHPGAFNPTTGSFNSGLESLLKRLAVIAVEDSHPERPEHVASLMWGAYLARRVKRWTPPMGLFRQWLAIAVGLYRDARYLAYDRRQGQAVGVAALGPNSEPLEQCVRLLDSRFLGSMRGDLDMFRDLARRFSSVGRAGVASGQPATMQLYHCVDQHWAPGMVYLTDAELVARLYDGDRSALPSAPFAPYFNYVFSRLTGLNTRHHADIATRLADRDIQRVVDAQRRYYRLYLKTVRRILTPPASIPSEPTTLSHTLHESWLSGLAGEMPTTIADTVTCLRVDNLTEPVPIRKLPPSAFRRPAEAEKRMVISPEHESKAVGETLDRLQPSRGVALSDALAPSVELKGRETYLEDGKFYLRPRGSKSRGVEWDQARTVTRAFTGFETSMGQLTGSALYQAYQIDSDGIATGHKRLLEKLLNRLNSEQLQYVLRYLDTFERSICMPKVQRDGTGEKQSLDIKLVYVNELLLALAKIYPGVVRTSQIGCFEIRHLPSYRWIVERVKQHLQGEHDLFSDKWGTQFRDTMIIDGKLRQPMSHQIESLEKMQQSHTRGIKGHFIWLPVGTGKSFLVLSYLAYLKSVDNLPPYVIYTLPASAIDTVLREILAFGVRVNYLDRTSDHKHLKAVLARNTGLSRNPLFLTKPHRLARGAYCDPEPSCINIIEHDHVRECPDELRDVAGRSVLIVDEVHKAMPQKGKETLRTSHIMLLARLCYQFVGMTGTAVTNNDLYQLMPWMRLVVPYTLSTDNYFTSLTLMIARKVNTGHRVHPEEIELADTDWPAEYLERYNGLIPPELGGNNLTPNFADLKAATAICYRVTDLFLVGKTLELVTNGKGVMLVAQDTPHAERLTDMLLEYDFPAGDILVLARQISSNLSDRGVDARPSVMLTSDAVKRGDVPDYRVVVVPKDRCEGYSLTRLDALVQAPYPSNQSKRDQLFGRINRLEPVKRDLYYFTFHTGLTTRMLKYHRQAASLRDFFNQMAKDIDGLELRDLRDIETQPVQLPDVGVKLRIKRFVPRKVVEHEEIIDDGDDEEIVADSDEQVIQDEELVTVAGINVPQTQYDELIAQLRRQLSSRDYGLLEQMDEITASGTSQQRDQLRVAIRAVKAILPDSLILKLQPRVGRSTMTEFRIALIIASRSSG